MSIEFDQLRKVSVGTKGILGFSVSSTSNGEVQLSDSEGRVIILKKNDRGLIEASRLMNKKKYRLMLDRISPLY